MHARGKHSSLLCIHVGDKEKSFETLIRGVCVKNFFSFVTVVVNKLACLSLPCLCSLDFNADGYAGSY
jgi:hypothetical protein